MDEELRNMLGKYLFKFGMFPKNRFQNWRQILDMSTGDAYILEKLIGSIVGEEDSEAMAYKLLSVYGTAGRAVSLLSLENAETLGVNSRLAELFGSIHQVNLSTLHQRISGAAFPGCRPDIVAFFCEKFPLRQTYIVQFFYFSGREFVGSGEPCSGTINSIEILGRRVFAEALAKNANRILPVIGLPQHIKNVDARVTRSLEALSMSAETLEISTEKAIIV